MSKLQSLTAGSPHDDLSIAGGYSAVSYTSSYKDDNGHGTHVAGIIGAKHNGYGIDGIAPEAQVYAVKALDQNGSGIFKAFSKELTGQSPTGWTSSI